MKKFIFKTNATMKEYNSKKWWIDDGIVKDITIHAETLAAAVELYREKVQETAYIDISNNAIKSRQPMYIDGENGEPKQIGFVITGKTEFEDRDRYKWSTQYIDLWVTVLTVIDTEF